MRLQMGFGDLVQLRTALKTVLTPLDAPDASEWRRRAADAVRQCIGADGGVVIADAPGEPRGVGVGQWDRLQSAVNRWTDEYQDRNPLDLRRRQMGVRYWTRFGLLPRATVYKSAYYNDWCRPSGDLDAAGLSAPADGERGLEGLLLVTSASANRFEPGGREEQLLSLIQPAFAAAVTILGLARTWRDALGSALDVAGLPLVIVQPNGQIVHATPALLAVIAGQPAGSLILAAAQALAREIGSGLHDRARESLPNPVSTLDTGQGQSVLRATLVNAAHLSSTPLVLVSVSSPAAVETSADTLRARYGLTGREAEVARRLARGERDRAIAQSLGISHNTVRRHVEHVYAKVGVHSRATLRDRLRD